VGDADHGEDGPVAAVVHSVGQGHNEHALAKEREHLF
jgi:hypothetical protein